MVPSHKFTAGRFLHALAVAKGDVVSALAYAQGQGNWADRDRVVTQCKAALTAMGSNDLPTGTPAAESFLPLMRPYAIPEQLAGFMRQLPMYSRHYTLTEGVQGAEVAEGQAIPVSKASYGADAIKPRRFAALIVRTKELANNASPVATQGLAEDLAQAVAAAENLKFVSPGEPGSVFHGQESFAGTGPAVGEIDADLKRLIDLVPASNMPGSAFVMAKGTASALSLKRGAGGALAYPTISPQGGTLLGLPVMVTPAMAGYIGLLAPSQVLWADEGVVQLMASTDAAIEQQDAPNSDSMEPTAAQMVSMYQTESIALRGVRFCNWYAKPGAAAYFSVTY